MIKQCNTCGTYWVVKDINECCPNCKEQKNFIKYRNEQEIVNKLNAYEYVVNKLDAMYEQNHKKEPHFYVFSVETKEILFIGEKEECKKYIKKHETIWNELVLMEAK